MAQDTQESKVDIEAMFPLTEPIDRKVIARIWLSLFLAKTALRFWYFSRILGGIGNKLRVPRQMADVERARAKYATLANLIPGDPEETGYTGDLELRSLFSYKNQMSNDLMFTHSESKVLYKKIVQVMSDLLRSAGNVKSVFNFGVSLGHVDSILAKEFQQVQFVGFDRSPLTKAINEVEFPEIDNLKFEFGDLFEHLDENGYENGVFFHSRTAILLNRPIVELVYDKAYEAGFEYIAGFEQLGLSRVTFKPFTFSLEETESVSYRSYMFIHNYPALMQKAGYRVESFEIFETGHPHPDYRITAFIGRRDPSLRQAK